MSLNFSISSKTIDHNQLRESVMTPEAGGFCSFEGWVRDSNEGHTVKSLEYQAYGILAEKQGNIILKEAAERYALMKTIAVHRTGHLAIGDIAVYVAVSSRHRDAAFAACRYIIDNIKYRCPIWKKEFYTDGTTEWIDPTKCHCADPDNLCQIHAHGKHQH